MMSIVTSPKDQRPAKPGEAAAPAATEAAMADELEGTLNVWSFTNEIRTMAIAFQGKHPKVKVVYTMIPMTNGEYQTKVKAAAGTADSPDVVALEAAFVKEWVESDLLADLNDLVPLTKELKTYPAVVQVGTYDGVTKGFSYQATPGAFFYRRSIAKECLGTDDPAEVQAMVADHGQIRRNCCQDQSMRHGRLLHGRNRRRNVHPLPGQPRPALGC